MRRTFILLLGFALVGLMSPGARGEEGDGDNPLAGFLKKGVRPATRKKVEKMVAEAVQPYPQLRAAEAQQRLVEVVVERVRQEPQRAMTQFVTSVSDAEARKAALASPEVIQEMQKQAPAETEFAVHQERERMGRLRFGESASLRVLTDWAAQGTNTQKDPDLGKAFRGIGAVPDNLGADKGEVKVGGVRIQLDSERLERMLEFAQARPEGAQRLLAEVWNSETPSVGLRSLLDTVDSEALAAPAVLEAQGLTVVSLRETLERRSRTLGALTRIHGYALDPSGDLFLLGKAETGTPLLDLDNLIVALRVVYRLGRTPAVSIDPDATQPGGAQKLSVFEVPPDSHFARIMADADYAMKLQMLASGDEKKVAGFQSFVDAIREAYGQGQPLPVGGRFWLTPVQPTSEDLYLSRNRKVALFNTAVQVLTEKGYCIDGGIVFTSRTEPAMEAAARSMTERYADFEKADPIFHQLHGLFDMVTLCTVLRIQEASCDLIGRLLETPVESIPVRSSYPGTVVQVEGVPFVLTGGVQILARMSQCSFRSHRVVEEISADIGAASRANFRIPRLRKSGRTEGEFELALKDIESGRYSRAAERLANNIEVDPADVSSRVMKAYAHAMQADWAAARETVLNALLIDPLDPFLRGWWNFVKIESGETSQAEVRENVDEESRKELAALYFWRSQLHLVKQKTGAAAADLDRSIAVYDRWEQAYFWRGYVAMAVGNRPAAEKDLERALEIDPNFAWAYLMRAFCKANREDLPGAVRDCDEALRVSPKFSPAHNNRGAFLWCMGRTEEAQREYRWAVEADPDEVVPRINIAWEYRDRGDTKRALEEIEEAVRRASTAIDRVLAGAYREVVLGRSEEAVRIYTQGIGWFGKVHPWVYADRGYVYATMGRYSEAVEDFAVAEPVASYDTYMLRRRAECLMRLGRTEEARRDLQKFLRLAPEHPEAADVKRMIEELP